MKAINLKAFAYATALLTASSFSVAYAQTNVTPAEARAIAKEAYIYGYPMVDGYRVQYAYVVDRQNPEFKAPWNQIRNISRVFTPRHSSRLPTRWSNRAPVCRSA